MSDRAAPVGSARSVKPVNEQTRYRVTGGLFLLAVVVIVVPMLFDGAGLAPVVIEPLDVPKVVPDVRRRVDVAPASEILERSAELAAQVDESGFQTDATGTRFGEPVLSEPGTATAVWAIQLASFESDENALKLRDRLRREGHEAFISTVRKSGRVLRRVAIGPFLEREVAEKLRDEISREFSLEARLVAFSN